MWLPTAKLLLEKLAWPEPLRATLAARTVAPSVNVTDPVGVPLPETRATVAVNVTFWPNVDGLTELPTAVVVAIPVVKVTVLSVDVEAMLPLPAASVATPAAIEAITVPAVVIPVTATL